MILKGTDTLQLYESDIRVNNAIEEIIQRTWADGFQKKYKEDDCLELKLKGHPFYRADGMGNLNTYFYKPVTMTKI